MTPNELLKGLDPDCQALNELCGRVEDQVKASGLPDAAEIELLKPLLAEHRATCEVCREYQPVSYLADYLANRTRWSIFAGAALGYVVGFGSGSPAAGIGTMFVVTLLLLIVVELKLKNHK